MFPGHTELNRRVMINCHFIGPDQDFMERIILRSALCLGSNAMSVRLPTSPQAFSVSDRNMWLLNIDELNEYRNTTGFGGNVHPEPST